MPLITVFDTFEKAEESLRTYHYQNLLTINEIYDTFAAMALIFKKYEGKKSELLEKTFREAVQQLGKGMTITSLLKLYSGSKGYGFDESYIDTDSVNNATFYSLEELAEGIQRRDLQHSLLSAKVTPFLYTVLEPYRFSEMEKEKARKLANYPQLDPSMQIKLDVGLDEYAELGLDGQERNIFEREYFKHFN